MCRIERREIPVVEVNGHFWAVTPEEARRIEAERQQDEQYSLEYVPTGTMQSGRIRNVRPMTRLEELEFDWKHARRGEGDRRPAWWEMGNVRKARRTVRHFSSLDTVDVLESIDQDWTD